MATRQYIGARYIPIFADPVEWDNTNSYQYLTMVQHQGETYMSRQAVPVGIDLPDISQGEESNAYWVHMSNWNAQVETYRQEVLQYNGRISTLEDDLPIADFDSTNTVKKYVDDSATAITNILPGSSFDSVNTVKKYIDDEDFKRALTFETVADMKASADLENGMICHTDGFYSAGDGGAAWYEISNAGTVNEMDVIACGALYATLVLENVVHPVEYGAKTDGTTDDSAVFTYLASKSGITVDLDGKTYAIDECVSITGEDLTFKNGTFNVTASDFTTYKGVFNAIAKDDIAFENVKFVGSGALNTGSISGRMVSLRECDNVKVVKCTALDIQYAYVFCFENCTNGEASNNYIENYTFAGINLLNGGDTFIVNDNKVINCVNTTYANTYPIGLSSGDEEYSRQPSRNIVCCGNYIDNDAAWWEGIDAHCIQNAVINDNVIKHCYSGIAIAQFKTGEGAIPSFYAENVTICGNQIDLGTVGTPKAVANEGIGLVYGKNCIIANNQIKNANALTTGSNQAGINLSYCSNVTVSGNNCHCVKDCCIAMRNANDHISILGNNFKVDTAGYMVFMDGLNVLCFVKDNVFHSETITADSRYFRGGTNDNTNPDQYVAFSNNITNVTDRSRQEQGNVLSDYSNPTGINNGYLGHVAMNSTPATGQPIGWICTTGATSSTPAVWTALPNL